MFEKLAKYASKQLDWMLPRSLPIPPSKAWALILWTWLK